jgi:hypothetical protein
MGFLLEQCLINYGQDLVDSLEIAYLAISSQLVQEAFKDLYD